jgi:hypothetical protein
MGVVGFQGTVGSGGEGVLSGWLFGHFGPQEASEFAGDRDGHDGRALAVGAEVAVSVKEADLRVPGALAGGRSAALASGRVAVVVGGFDQQAAGVPVAAFGDVPAVLGLAG